MMISYLADYPEYVPVVASWIFYEWDCHAPGMTLHQVETKFRNHLNRDSLPLAVIALADGLPVGTASLIIHDMDTRPDLSPWLAAVYVPPEHRNQGIGSAMVRAVEDVGKRLRIGRLYLFTPDRERFYARLGWSVMERTEYRNQRVAIMVKSLVRPGGHRYEH
jgi:GNAT superfamily N-acetyltransferase